MAILIIASVSGQGIIIHPGAKLTSFGGNVTITGNLTNSGTMADLGGTIIFTGTDQIIGGSSISTFNNVNIAASSTTTLQSHQVAGGIVTVNGTLNSDGFLTLISTASKTALVNGAGIGQISGHLVMERYLASGFGYKYISSPFQSASVSELSDDLDLLSSFPSVYSYDENRASSGWVNYTTSSNILEPLSGYAVNFGEVHAPLTWDVEGIVNNGNQSITLYNNDMIYTEGYNLVGNPYPSPIDWYAPSGWTKTNIDDALYFFNASATDQYGGHYSTLIDGASSDGSASNIIPSMQGFFVHVNDGVFPVTGTIGMDNNVRVNNQSQSYIKGDNEKPLIRFTAGFSDNTTSVDYAVIYFDENATHEFDGKLDALKLMNTDVNTPNFYFVTPSVRNLQIYALPPLSGSLQKIPLGMKTSRDGNIIIRIRDIDSSFSNIGISITDIIKGTEHSLEPGNEFQIFLKAGEYKDRFFLNLSDIATEVNDIISEQEIFRIYYSNDILHTEINNSGATGTLSILNLLGQTLYTDKIYGDGYQEHNFHLKDGIYIASYVSGKKRINRKIPIKN
jgi:hypothetical protein